MSRALEANNTMGLLFTILLGGIVWLNYLFHRRLMAPPVLFSLLWAVSVGLHSLFSVTLLDGLYPISIPTLLLFTGGVLVFSLGGMLYLLYNKPDFNTTADTHRLSLDFPPFSFLFRLSLILICVVTLPFFIQKAIELFVKSQAENFFVGLRSELSYGEEGLGPLKYIVNFSIFVYGICQIEQLRFPTMRNKVIMIVSLLLAIIYAIFFTGRTYFIMLLAMYVTIQMIYNHKYNFRRLLYIGPTVIILFTVIGLVYDKGGSLDEHFASNLKTSSQNTALYFSGSLSAFDWEVNHNFSVTYNGQNSLRFFYVIAAALGLTSPLTFNDSIVQEFVFIPYETNVFTIYSPYVRDFGYAYPLFVLFAIGLLQTWLYAKALNTGSPRFAIYSSLLMYPLVMSFFQDQYFSLLSVWLQSVAIIETFFFANKLFIRKVLPETSNDQRMKMLKLVQ